MEFSIRLWQFAWLMNLCMVLFNGVLGNYAGALSSALFAVLVAALLQWTADGEDLLYNFYTRKFKKVGQNRDNPKGEGK